MTESLNWGTLMGDAGGAGSFETLPPGDYDAVVSGCKVQKSGNSKTMFVAEFTIESGPFANRKFWNNFVVSTDNPNALGWFFSNMNVLGLSKEFFAQNPSNDQVAANLVGKRCRANLQHRTWQGQVKTDVKKIMPPMGGQTAPSVGAPGVPVIPPAPTFAPAVPNVAPAAPVMPTPPVVAPPAPPVPAAVIIAAEEVPPPPTVMPAAPQFTPPPPSPF